MMRVTAVSDLHGHLPHITPCELLLLGGDYCPFRDDEKERKFIDGPFRDWLETVPAKYIVGIAGNHDFMLQKDPAFAKGLPWFYLQDEMIDLEGVKIYGTPWTYMLGDWAFTKSESDLQEIFKNIPCGLDILLSHGPAFGRLDKVHEMAQGSVSLLQAIQRAVPDSVVHGHIHEGRGILQDGNVRYYNVTYCNSRNSPIYNPMTVELVIPGAVQLPDYSMDYWD